ncbi:MAG: peptide ABC transporter [Cereibacter sphaeroides]|uniref:Peptide ABC transporter n=1 Tax=Cereibacter sphaeroides TaxID=1063 RepID=A0A2W5SDM3_CERSP|nr:MAG: peptide ABC transporter [Cereibacter sphaeroides]
MKLRTALLGAVALAAMAPAAFAERGSDGEVKLTFPQAVSTLNSYLSGGTKDVIAASMVIEPLAGFDPTGTIFPRLVTEIPTLENGGISADMKTVTWKLLPDLKWSDGTDFTADDVVFTAQYCMDPAGGCAQGAKFAAVEKVEAVDPKTVKVTFKGPQPNPYTAFVGGQSPIIQKKQFEKCLGAAAPTCTAENSGPIGTGPFVVTGFTVNDTVTLEANPNYRDPAKPAFAKATIKGGGDAIGSARAVMETGEFDYAWNTQIPPEAQTQMTAAGKGQFAVAFGTLVERLEMNLTDPSSALAEGERSTVKHPHPILSDMKVRQALSMAIDRQTLVDVGYGAAGKPTCNLVPAPEIFASDNTGCLKQDMDGAKAMLEEAGWKVGADGIREKDGKKLSLVYQTTVNPIRQDFQSLIKSWWTDLGVEVELKSIDPGVFFGGDAGSPDTYQKFYADVEMYANNFDGTDPEVYLANYLCDRIPGPDSQWQGENVNRFCDPEYDKLVAELSATGNIEKRAEIARKLNDMLTKDSMVIVPLVHRGELSAHSNTLGGVAINSWDAEIWNTADWYRVK